MTRENIGTAVHLIVKLPHVSPRTHGERGAKHGASRNLLRGGAKLAIKSDLAPWFSLELREFRGELIEDRRKIKGLRLLKTVAVIIRDSGKVNLVRSKCHQIALSRKADLL